MGLFRKTPKEKAAAKKLRAQKIIARHFGSIEGLEHEITQVQETIDETIRQSSKTDFRTNPKFTRLQNRLAEYNALKADYCEE